MSRAMNEMPAGRDLDALVAEKVMGLTMLTQAEMVEEAERTWAEQPGCVMFTKGFEAWRNPDGSVSVAQLFRPYSTKIAAAWAVVEKMRDDHTVTLQDADELWYVDFIGFEGKSKDGFAQADTAPLAICRAALLAVGITECPDPESLNE